MCPASAALQRVADEIGVSHQELATELSLVNAEVRAGVERTRALIRAAGLPDVAPDLGVDTYLEYMGHDKKVEGGKMRFVLLKKLGEAVITGDVPTDVLNGVLTAPH